MGLLLSLKTLVRTPLKTLLTFFLLFSVSFALFSKVGEHVVTTREVNKVAENYKGIGAIERQPPKQVSTYNDHFLLGDYRNTKIQEKFATDATYEPLRPEDIAAVKSLPYVSDANPRYMTAGIAKDLVKVDDTIGYYNYSARVVVEGTVAVTEASLPKTAWDLDIEYLNKHRITITDCKLLAGDPKVERYGYSVSTLTTEPEFYAVNGEDTELTASQTRRATMIYGRHNIDYIQQLEEGQRYIFVLRYDPLSMAMNGDTYFFLGDRVTELDFDTIYSLKGKPKNYIETDEFADLRQLIKITNDDIHTFDMVYTDNMDAILRFAEKSAAITEGRLLTKTDSDNNAPVCVVSGPFMMYNKLSLGDKITVKLGNQLHEQIASLGSTAVIPGRTPTEETTVELEIVGVFRDLDSVDNRVENPRWSYNSNTIFVPLSLLPVSQEVVDGFSLRPGEFSFVISNAWDIPKFLEKSVPVLESMGLNLIFYDGGWPELAGQFGIEKTLSSLAIITLLVAVFMSIGITVYLFIGRKKNEYAIMRALGTTVETANRSLLIPILVVSIIAVICGNAASWVYTNGTIANTLASLPLEGYKVDMSIPPISLVGCIAVEIIVLYGFARFGLWHIGQKPPLELLQADDHVAQLRNKKVYTSKTTDVSVNMVAIPKFEITGGQYGVIHHTCRYIFLFSKRSAFKTVLSIMLAALLFGALGQFAALKRSNEDLYKTIDVTAYFSNGLDINQVLKISKSDYVKSSYYEYTDNDVECNGLWTSLFMTNDIERFAGTSVETEYAYGYDSSVLLEEEPLCIMGASLMDQLGVKLGDTVDIMPLGLADAITLFYPKAMGEKEIENHRLFYKVVGRVTCEDPKIENAVYVPTSKRIGRMYLMSLEYRGEVASAEFTLKDNSLASEFRSYLIPLSEYTALKKKFVMDTTQIDSIASNIQIFNALFPVVAAVLTIIGGLLPGLMIVQSAKEVAIMRVLGTSKKRTRAILVLQHLSMSLIGMTVGFIAVWVYNGTASIAAVGYTIMLCGVLYFAACICAVMLFAVLVTQRKPLELLQVKE